MRGFVAITDPIWYQVLFELGLNRGPGDANFWRPSTRRVNELPGTPFFFKLRAPHRAIGGFGVFAAFSVLPDWLAYETFGLANGVVSLDELRQRLSTLRESAEIDADPQGRIGCSLIAQAVFFAPDEWVAAPSDWKQTQIGAGIDLSQGEGLRVWNECRERASGVLKPTLGTHAREPAARYGAPMLIRPRLGQGIFRINVLDEYRRACAVTNEHSLVVLEAAHVRPYSHGGEHDVTNGLALRTDLHKLFDRGYVTIDSQQRFVVGRRLKQDFDNGRTYYELQGREISSARSAAGRVSADALSWHRENRFLG